MLGQPRRIGMSLPPGRLERAKIRRTRRRSAARRLKRLYQASLDFTAITKFSAEELAFAREIGDEFQIYKKFWARTKSLMADGRPFRLFNEGQARAVVGFFTLLLRHGIATKCDAQMQARPNRQLSLDLTAVVRNCASRRLPKTSGCMMRLSKSTAASSHCSLVAGSRPIRTTCSKTCLIRLSADFETYSRVQYRGHSCGRSDVAWRH